MKKSFLLLFVLIIVAVIIWGFTQHETVLAPTTVKESVSANYSNPTYKFSLTLPGGYVVDENYIHQISATRNINGVKFTIPESLAKGTNLSTDSSLSVESIPNTTYCTAELFTDYPNQKPDVVTDGATTYYVITTTDAGAGNRYEELIFAIQGSNPCLAVRYFIHYGAIQNYSEGTVKEFDRTALLAQFDAIRKSMKIK